VLPVERPGVVLGVCDSAGVVQLREEQQRLYLSDATAVVAAEILVYGPAIRSKPLSLPADSAFAKRAGIVAGERPLTLVSLVRDTGSNRGEHRLRYGVMIAVMRANLADVCRNWLRDSQRVALSSRWNGS